MHCFNLQSRSLSQRKTIPDSLYFYNNDSHYFPESSSTIAYSARTNSKYNATHFCSVSLSPSSSLYPFVFTTSYHITIFVSLQCVCVCVAYTRFLIHYTWIRWKVDFRWISFIILCAVCDKLIKTHIHFIRTNRMHMLIRHSVLNGMDVWVKGTLHCFIYMIISLILLVCILCTPKLYGYVFQIVFHFMWHLTFFW